ncbi:MAG: hypothetical protein P8179_25145 [Candidatus Thiodiazotropha sp.]
MLKIRYTTTAIVFIQLLTFIRPLPAVEYINLDFEDTDTGRPLASDKPYPVWTIPISKEMGSGNMFKVVDTTSHNGSHSLQFSYHGKNNFCNTCGTVVVKHKQGFDGVNFFVADTGEDLTLEQAGTKQLPHAKIGTHVYNRSRGYSLWEVASITNQNAINDKLTLKLLNPGIGEYESQPSVFNSGDKVAIARQCGVDGIVGTLNGEFLVDRRSDCNNAIIWFKNVTPQAPGTSIFRRVYLKAEVTSPHIHQKLHYLRPDSDGINKGSIVIFADDNRNPPVIEPILTGFAQYGDFSIVKPGLHNGFDGLEFERSTWYYMEEQFKAATQDLDADPSGNTYKHDGEYRLWFSKSSEAKTVGATPILVVTDLALPPINPNGNSRGTHISLWGNNQHMVHAYGHWYMDDIIISDSPIGPASPPGPNNAKPPEAPTDVSIRE